MKSIKVVTASEMGRIEGLAYAAGALEADFMERAGAGVAEIVAEYIAAHGFSQVVTMLVGKGNNGADAYVAGRHLIDKGFIVEAYHIYSLDTCGPLSRQMYEQYKQKGGKSFCVRSPNAFQFEPQGIILDGLVGTGFHGKAEGLLAQAIVAANESRLPIIAIDIPSGVNGNTGDVETVAIHADLTIYLELPKMGFFLKDAWNYVGNLRRASFGLDEHSITQAKAEAYLLQEPPELPLMHRTRNKYEAGYVLAVAGSPEMPGAALLACEAALHSGAGIVRLFYPLKMQVLLSAAPYELIREEWDWEHNERILEEAKRAKAIFIGPGMGRSKEKKKGLKSLLAALTIPCVLDADALFFLGNFPAWELPEQCVLTPHRGEMQHLLQKPFELADCERYAEEKQVVLVLKGAPTFIFAPEQKPLIVTAGDPGMATAGTGDVLTGMIASLIAQGMDPFSGSVLAVALHGKAGECAALKLTSYCMTASDLISYLPEAFQIGIA